MNSRMLGLSLALAAAVAVSALTPAPASIMTEDSVNVFRRFSIDRAKDLAFYNEAVGLQPQSALNVPGGGQMALFHIGSDVERGRAFYREFVGLDELPAVDSAFGKTYRFKLGAKSTNILNLWAAHPGAAANTYTAGISTWSATSTPWTCAPGQTTLRLRSRSACSARG